MENQKVNAKKIALQKRTIAKFNSNKPAGKNRFTEPITTISSFVIA
ncbi:MAG: hypothetical protein AAGI07_01270 [Bacteroidota bacterium]